MTKYLNLDELSAEREFFIKLSGKDHLVQEPTVQDFLDNLKELEALPINASPTEELNLTIKQLLRSVPTLTDPQLRKLTFSQVKAIHDFVMTAGGQKIETEETKDGEVDPKPAS
ncbi:hypothetical protein [Phyllobacterium myrsinacearum]|uniref:Phage tail assembly protein n=1 Tax=Phyllobacterium myrsinacearum TaxID=28101 RepID=A0A839ES20_9HYPH|nr:hypothetical protein [Phyllobacterium myrsinacearum]MBA8881729.1 hypothetical protein [Phyllobacterium myrsinacearum]